MAGLFGAPRNALIGSQDVFKAKPRGTYNALAQTRPAVNALAPRGTGMFAAKKRPEMKAYNPSWAEKAQQKLSDLLTGLGMDRNEARRTSANLTSFLNDWTPVGNVVGVADADNDLERQLSMLPLPGPARQAVGQAMKGIRAFHGSPHDFDRFDITKIGTGEGAQAYGHGLYFAENEDVARSYRDVLGHRALASQDPGNAAGFWTQMHGGDRDAAAQTFRAMKDQHARIIDRAAKGLPLAPGALENARSEIAKADEALAALASGSIPQPGGRMYEVNINADPNALLDWDKLVEDQADLADRILPNRVGHPGQLYTDFANSLGLFPGDPQGKVRASQEMLARGIPGIRYLDQGSRQAGNGSRNYVIFDDKLVDIVRKY